MTATHQRELILPLLEGLHESPPWGEFLRQLVAKTHARRACLVIMLANAGAHQKPPILVVSSPRAKGEPPLDFERIAALVLYPYGKIRPGRVYSFDELLDYDRPERRDSQRAALKAMGIRYGRVLRVSAGNTADAWMVLVRERENFTGAAVATLSAVAPYLTAGLTTLTVLIEQRLRVALAQSALQRLGIGQIAFDGTGRVMAADPQAESLLSFVPEPGPASGRRLQLAPATAHALSNACALLAATTNVTSLQLPLDINRGLWILMHKPDLSLKEPCASPAAIGALRIVRRENPLVAQGMLSAIYGLSANEASLAHQISLGATIVEAGKGLHLTPETSRNYSKRIYAKTGTSSQADLVRLILTGLVPMA